MRCITFTADEELADELAREAKRRRRSVSAVIRERLRSDRGPKVPRRFSFIGKFKSDDDRSAERLDDYLAENWARDIMRHQDP